MRTSRESSSNTSVKPRRKRRRAQQSSAWVVYLLECRGGALYAGCTNDLAKRLESHEKGKGGRYTRSHAPVKLAYAEPCRDRSTALKREWALKRLTRAEKIALVRKRQSG